MISRCTNPKSAGYKNYGGRGIYVCEEWFDYEVFITDMGEKPGPKYSLDRINNDGPYSKDNCRWATPKEQARNTRTNKWISFNGKTQLLSDWAAELGISHQVILDRLKKKWPIEKVLSTEDYRLWLIEYDGRTQTLEAWAREIGMDSVSLSDRFTRGWDVEKALTTKPKKFNKFTYKGQTKTLGLWAREYSIHYQTLYHRIFNLGWTIEKALTTPADCWGNRSS
jgi:hypothetical protein